MNSRRNMSLAHLLMILTAIVIFEGTSYAQFSVALTGTTFDGDDPIENGRSAPAPSEHLYVKATIEGTANITRVVFYRNDVPYKTVTSSPYRIEQDQLGQETYTYHARAYDDTGHWEVSNDYKLTFTTRNIIRMGDDWPVKTHPPGRFQDHTQDIQDAVDWLGARNGGTLFFPCTIPPDAPAIYNIKSTIYIRPGVTLQGESAEEGGPCRIYWNDVDAFPHDLQGCHQTPVSLQGAAMFKIVGDTSRVRFRDLLLMSRTTGPWCGNRTDWKQIANDNTAAVEMNTDDPEGTGDITDIIFENVAIDHFTRGIKAVSSTHPLEEYEISGVKIRAFKPYGNTVALFIDARFAYNWDIQNLNPASIVPGQGAVEIRKAGRPSVTDGESTNIKFLQLNCNGIRANPRPFCVKVQKHGGLYFRQLHQEGVDKAIIVEDISGNRAPNNTNPDPIVFESSVASGEFNDPSMKLYLIGNGLVAAPEMYQTGLDDVRLKFKGLGRDSTVVDCGDIHWDWTDIVDNGGPYWPDFQMLFTHSERYRGSFFAETGDASYIKPHRYCPRDVPGLPNIDEIGGDFFDSGILPNEPGLYSHQLDYDICPPETCNVAQTLKDLLALGGSVYITETFTLTETVTVPRGSQIIGAPDAELILDASNTSLFRLHVKMLTDENQIRLSGVVIRNLKLSANPNRSNTTGIAMIGEFDPDLPPPPDTGRPGASSDIHFSRLTFEGFTRGIYAAPDPGERQGHPMIDGLSMKDMTFINNDTAVFNISSNASNWNVMNLSIQSFSGAVGWSQITGGHQGLQDVRCTGPGAPFEDLTDCLRIRMAGGFFLNGLRPTTEVSNALTVGESGIVNYQTIYEAPQPATMVLRNSDFTGIHGSGRMNVLGKAFITSMNNKYHYFTVESQYANQSRLTYCGDTYLGEDGAVYPGLADFDTNLWVGLPTPTRVHCGERPIPWDEAVRWTNKFDENFVGKPMVGNFFHDTQEDFVVYRAGSPSKFLIQQPGGPGRLEIDWGIPTDVPLIGNFFPNSWAQIVVFRDGAWWVNDPKNSANNAVWSWGLPEDRPFVGNFLKESSSSDPEENKDEIAVYRPSTKTFWITNPRLGGGTSFTTTVNKDSEIQVADFLGAGYDQIAQYVNGEWNIVDPRTGYSYTVNFGVCEAQEPCDIPIAGRYLEQLPERNPCAQVAVWRPSTQQFLIADPMFVATNPPNLPTNCGSRTKSMVWGLNNGSDEDDIPLTINAADFPLLRRPTAYRRTKGIFDHSLANGQWWVHDRF